MPLFRYPVTFGLLLTAGGMMWLPAEIQAKLRLTIGDLVKPGCILWERAGRSLADGLQNWRTEPFADDSETRRLKSELATAANRARELEIRLARQQDEAAAHHPPLFAHDSSENPERLAHPLLMEAAVLGPGHAAAWRKGRWLDQGKAAGLIEEAPILISEQPLLDLGRDARLSAEDAILLGRSVIGKVSQVGRWTSTFLLVTDGAYRGRAQLVRETSEGYVFGAKGVLKGQDEPLCRLDGIPAEDIVDVGDSVYTADRDGLLPTPLYFGKVVEASLPDRAREWHILVQPADRPDDLTKVQILRSALNPRRGLAN